MGVSWDNIALCIKLCKSNFYWVEFSDTQVEVRILLNVDNSKKCYPIVLGLNSKT